MVTGHMTTQAATTQAALQATPWAASHDAVVDAMNRYVQGVQAGDSNLMRPAFHPDATGAGLTPNGPITGSIQQIFDWVDANGPSPTLEARFAAVEVIESIAHVRVEIDGISGKLAGERVRMSDLFVLVRFEDGWKIVHKSWHWHTD